MMNNVLNVFEQQRQKPNKPKPARAGHFYLTRMDRRSDVKVSGEAAWRTHPPALEPVKL